MPNERPSGDVEPAFAGDSERPEESLEGLRDYERELVRWYRQSQSDLKNELAEQNEYERELRELYTQTGDDTFLQEATSCREIISSRWEQWDTETQRHIQKFREWEELKDCGVVLSEWFEQTDDETFLQEAVACIRNALTMTNDGVGSTAYTLGLLGVALKGGFQHIGDRESLEEAITVFEASLHLLEPHHPGRSFVLMNLGSAMRFRFEISGDSADLDAAIAYNQSGLQLRDPARCSTFQNNLANALLVRFENGGDQRDLEAAIVYYQDALLAKPPGHPERWSSLTNLGTALGKRFSQVGDRADLDAAIVNCQNALQLLPVGHSERWKGLSNVSWSLATRFNLMRDRADLDAAIFHCQSAIETVPPGHPDHSSCLSHIGQLLATRFDEFGDREDLDEAITIFQSFVHQNPFIHQTRHSNLVNLGDALLARFWRYEDRVDLDEAISNYQAALQAQLPGDIDRCVNLTNLASALIARFKEDQNREDIEVAISNCENALEQIPVSHRYYSSTMTHLADAIIHLEESDGRINPALSNDLSLGHKIRGRVIDLLREASSSASGGSLADHLSASSLWASTAVKWSDPSSITAHLTALSSLEALIASKRTIESRHFQLASSRHGNSLNLALDGAACAIASGQIELAVEMLEQGRSMLLTQTGRYRTPLDDLEVVQPALVEAFRRVSTQMEASVMTLDRSAEEMNLQRPLVDPIAAYQNLASEWTDIVEKIRKVEGFSTFLLPASFHMLRAAASGGPVIIFNSGRLRTDAIIVFSSVDPLLVPLPRATWDCVLGLMVKTHFLVGEDRTAKDQDGRFTAVLHEIWEAIIQPVVTTLQHRVQLPRGSRIWLCPTGLMTPLPLHAAGDYMVPDQNLPDIYVCSYTPTLSALLRAHQKQIFDSPSQSTSILVVGQSKTPGQTELPAVRTEIRSIEASIPKTTVLEEEEATRVSVLRAMALHPWVHLACHGHVDVEDSFESNFALHDGPLNLPDIIKQNLPLAELAFLSACHSAKLGVWSRQDEVLHLASAIQFAGFRSVVGTLWALCDVDGPIVAEAFYSSLMGTKGRPRAKSTAHALHRAVAELRGRREVSFYRWACFVHIGV